MAENKQDFDYVVPIIPTRMTMWTPSPVYTSGTASRFIKVGQGATELITINHVRALLRLIITGETPRPFGASVSNLYEVKIFAVPPGINLSSPPPYNSTDFLFCSWKDMIGRIELNIPTPGMSSTLYIYVKNLTTAGAPETVFVAVALEM